MEKNDTEKILEAIQSLKKEQEEEIQLLKKEQRKIREENQEIKDLLKSMNIENNEFQKYNENSEVQDSFHEDIDTNDYMMDDIMADIVDDFYSANKEFRDEKQLYSKSQAPKNEMDTLNLSNTYRKSMVEKFMPPIEKEEYDDLDMGSEEESSDDLDSLPIIMHKRVRPVKKENYVNLDVGSEEESSDDLDSLPTMPKRSERRMSVNLDMRKESSKLMYNHNDALEDMSIISFLARSDKRIQILRSLNDSDKIPSMISKEIGDSNHHVSKYLKAMKEKELVVCLNEEDKRFRFYSITPKGKKYLKIMEEKNY